MTTVAENIARIQQAKADIKAAIEAKGGTVGDGTIDTYALAVGTIPSGGGGTNAYAVNSVEEMNAIQNPANGTICVVQGSAAIPYNVAEVPTNTLVFPKEIKVPKTIASTMLQTEIGLFGFAGSIYEDSSGSVDGTITVEMGLSGSSGFSIYYDNMNASDTPISISYIDVAETWTDDEVTFTRDDENPADLTITLSKPMYVDSTNFTTVVGYFMKYREEKNVNLMEPFISMRFPEQVVMPTAVTAEALYGMLYYPISDLDFEYMAIVLTPTEFFVNSDSATFLNISANYTSLDGITYTRNTYKITAEFDIIDVEEPMDIDVGPVAIKTYECAETTGPFFQFTLRNTDPAITNFIRTVTNSGGDIYKYNAVSQAWEIA